MTPYNRYREMDLDKLYPAKHSPSARQYHMSMINRKVPFDNNASTAHYASP